MSCKYGLDVPERQGTWWLPGKDQQKAVGTFSFNRHTQGRLRLHNVPTDYDLIRSSEYPKQHPVILGQMETGELVTLLHCVTASFSLNSMMPRARNVVINAGKVVVGGWYLDENDVVTKRLTVSFSGLTEWMNKRLIIRNSERSQIQIASPMKFEYRLDNTVSVTFETQVVENFRLYETCLRQKAQVRFEFSNPVHVSSVYAEQIIPLMNLLSLFICQPVFPLCIEFSADSNKPTVTTVALPQQYIISHVGIELFDESDAGPQTDMLFDFSDIASSFEIILSEWYRLNLLANISLQLYFSYRLKRTYLQHHFLVLIQVIEGLHRAIKPPKYSIASARFEKIRRQLRKHLATMNDVPEELQTRINESLAHANEFSLKERVTQILNVDLKQLQEEVDNLVSDQRDHIEKLIRYRNHLTHYPSQEKIQKILDDPELYRLVQQVDILIQIWLCILIGISADQIKSKLEQHRPYNHWKATKT